jgi:uncharacterized Zn finger protein (UPF0148 family)
MSGYICPDCGKPLTPEPKSATYLCPSCHIYFGWKRIHEQAEAEQKQFVFR